MKRPILSGLDTILEETLEYGMPDPVIALGVASAYVSAYGVRWLDSLPRSGSDSRLVRIVTNLSDGITHPSALRYAHDAGWGLRAFNDANQLMHSKMIVAAERFTPDDSLDGRLAAYIGSANLTRGGLVRNIESGILYTEPDVPTGLSAMFTKLWKTATPLSPKEIDDYESWFAQINRRRVSPDLVPIDISDSDTLDPGEMEAARTPSNGGQAMGTSAAHIAWAGLESFTGEYTLQIEFPRNAGVVVGQMLQEFKGTHVPVYCQDGAVREMAYRYYPDNGMFRLNVPNDVPNVSWARREKSGIGIVEFASATSKHDAHIEFRIARPDDPEYMSIREKSLILGTWGRTTTRLYGWL